MLSIWSDFLQLTKQEVGTQVVETWFKCVSFENYDEKSKQVILRAPNQFVANWIHRNYLNILQNGLERLLKTNELSIIFKQGKLEENSSSSKKDDHKPLSKNATKSKELLNGEKIVPAKKAENLTPSSHQAAILTSINRHKSQNQYSYQDELAAQKIGINSKYRFDTFIVGPHNHLAYSASLAISKGAVKGYNPLFIYGSTGLGKTHLLNCIGNETRRTRPNAKIVYKSSDKFVDEFIKSIRFDQIDHFKEKYTTVDLLLIDDIQFLSQKEQTQEVFFHIFNSMHQRNKQIVLSSDVPPNQISGLQERLKSRFGWGLVADISPPTFETKVAILIKKAEELKISLPHSIAEKIASKISSNIRELEGALTRISTLSILNGTPISSEIVDQSLHATELENNNYQKTNSCPNEIIKKVARFFSVSTQDIKSDKRSKNIAFARQVAMYLLRKHTSFSLKAIGELFGGRSHSTVLHAIENVDELVKSNLEVAKKVKTITNSNHT